MFFFRLKMFLSRQTVIELGQKYILIAARFKENHKNCYGLEQLSHIYQSSSQKFPSTKNTI